MKQHNAVMFFCFSFADGRNLQHHATSISVAFVHYWAIGTHCVTWEPVCVLAGCPLAMCEVCGLVLIRLLTVQP